MEEETGLIRLLPKRLRTVQLCTMAKGFWYHLYHYSGMFYNTKVMADAELPKCLPTGMDFLLSVELQSKGITQAFSSKNRWPAQFWFDYLLLRSAGPDYRAQLMAGKHPMMILKSNRLWGCGRRWSMQGTSWKCEREHMDRCLTKLQEAMRR